MNQRRTQLGLTLIATILAVVGLVVSPVWGQTPEKPHQLKDRAAEAEQRGRWVEASHCYDQLLRIEPANADFRERFQLCLRHVHQLRRHRDPSFLKTVLGRNLTGALNVYEEVLYSLRTNYLDKDRVQLTQLFQRGLQELRFALEEETFLQEHLPGVSADKVRAFILVLDPYLGREIATVQEARIQAREIALRAMEVLELSHAVTILEFVCGACNSLDEYTFYLTPNQMQYVQASLKGEHVGVGIKLAWLEGKFLIAAVFPNSPAAQKGIKPGDRLLRIDGQSLDNLGADHVAARLMGRQGSTVEVELLSPLCPDPSTFKLMRQPVLVPSVEWDPELREGIGYARILSFQESTPQELREAVLQLQMMQMKALVLDLRGNGGGHLRAAVQVAESFLTEGTIVIMDSPLKRFKTTYKANNASAWTMPVVVLIDGDTASAAEVVAGALKENHRATLVGTPTFGKGLVQCPLPLETAPSGIWITVAKFFSPTNQPYSGRGVIPNIAAGNDGMEGQRSEAWRAAVHLTMMDRR